MSIIVGFTFQATTPPHAAADRALYRKVVGCTLTFTLTPKPAAMANTNPLAGAILRGLHRRGLPCIPVNPSRVTLLRKPPHVVELHPLLFTVKIFCLSRLIKPAIIGQLLDLFLRKQLIRVHNSRFVQVFITEVLYNFRRADQLGFTVVNDDPIKLLQMLGLILRLLIT